MHRRQQLCRKGRQCHLPGFLLPCRFRASSFIHMFVCRVVSQARLGIFAVLSYQSSSVSITLTLTRPHEPTETPSRCKMAISINRGTSIDTPKYDGPCYYGDPSEGSPNFGDLPTSYTEDILNDSVDKAENPDLDVITCMAKGTHKVPTPSQASPKTKKKKNK